MTDEELITCFEAGTLAAERFHHRDHLKVVWLYLNRYPVIVTLERFADHLRRFAAVQGQPNLYHATITWGFVFLINERRERAGRDQSWEEFVAVNADLFDWKNNVLGTYYENETLNSDLARKVFIFPDRHDAAV